MLSSQPKRGPRFPAWAWPLVAGYCFLLIAEVAMASSGVQVALALFAGLAVGPLGVVVIAAAVSFWLYDQTVLLIRGITTTAIVEGYSRPNPRSDVRYPTYRYRPHGGDELINTSPIGVIFERAKGTKVLVRYDPKCPQLVARLRFPILRTLVGLLLIALGTMMVVGFVTTAVRIL